MSESNWQVSLPLDVQLPPQLEAQAEAIRGACAPCVALVVDPEAEGESRLRGRPRVPKGFPWPKRAERDTTFVGQIDFAALRADLGADAPPCLPRGGVLAFFYDADEQPWGYRPTDREGWALVYTRAHEETELLPEQAPARPLRHRVAWSLLDYRGSERLEASEPSLELEDVEWELYSDLYWAHMRARPGVPPGGEVRGQLLGHPNWVQHDARVQAQLTANGIYTGNSAGYDTDEAKQLRAHASDWLCLWQIPSDDDFMWGDCGNLYVMIRREDLAARRFEAAWVVLQCF